MGKTKRAGYNKTNIKTRRNNNHKLGGEKIPNGTDITSVIVKKYKDTETPYEIIKLNNYFTKETENSFKKEYGIPIALNFPSAFYNNDNKGIVKQVEDFFNFDNMQHVAEDVKKNYFSNEKSVADTSNYETHNTVVNTNKDVIDYLKNLKELKNYLNQNSTSSMQNQVQAAVINSTNITKINKDIDAQILIVLKTLTSPSANDLKTFVNKYQNDPIVRFTIAIGTNIVSEDSLNNTNIDINKSLTGNKSEPFHMKFSIKHFSGLNDAFANYIKNQNKP